ncbi:hypothetical protein [Nitratidesulfovibrio termitidis]|uniref:hypothetical protein n=1 Tax=Nitratidesulfovibrio termitidis TaxID=42252 RepID=UPI0006883ACE|nr:hypothetical protein [Nitratidesulfovibrio termitidis]
MELSKKHLRIVRKALDGWQSEGILTTGERTRLEESISASSFDWQRLARYALWIAIACLVTALGSLFSDSYLLEQLLLIFQLSAIYRAVLSGTISVALYAWGFTRRHRHPERRYTNEALLSIGVIATAIGIWQLGVALSTDNNNPAPLLLMGCGIYATIGWFGRSGLVWTFFLLSLGSYVGLESGYQSGWGAYWLGMNYPLRFVLFGALLTMAAYALRSPLMHRGLERVTLSMGLLYLFVALWILSIFGNLDSGRWQGTRQSELFEWSLLFAIAACTAIWVGLRTDCGMLRGFGITFLGINIYTRYFEIFWDSIHKVVFFTVLAVSFFLIARHAERIWQPASHRGARDASPPGPPD